MNKLTNAMRGDESNESFSMKFEFDQPVEEIFKAILNVRAWWSETLEGHSEKLDDVFIYRHGNVHYSKHKLIEVVENEKVVWQTLDSKLSFVSNQSEWNGTKMIFEILEHQGKTILGITHEGLIPSFECYDGCSRGWTHYLKKSLVSLIQKGEGIPDKAKGDKAD